MEPKVIGSRVWANSKKGEGRQFSSSLEPEREKCLFESSPCYGWMAKVKITLQDPGDSQTIRISRTCMDACVILTCLPNPPTLQLTQPSRASAFLFFQTFALMDPYDANRTSKVLLFLPAPWVQDSKIQDSRRKHAFSISSLSPQSNH